MILTCTRDEGGNIALISLYVDDLIIIAIALKLIEEIKTQLSQVFEMKDLCELHYCLGHEIWKESGKTIITQSKYAKTILERFHMFECKPMSIPLEQNAKLYGDDGSKEVNGILYHQLVGTSNYLTTTRPDIAYSVSVLSQFMAKPCESYWKAKKKVLRYLNGELFFCILYIDESDVELVVFSDSDWAGNSDDRRSTYGYAFNLGAAIVSWSSKCDNQSSMKLENNPIYHARTKHIEVQHHFVRGKIQSNEIHLVYCNTNGIVADIFTKCLGKMNFEICRQQLGIFENPFLH